MPIYQLGDMVIDPRRYPWGYASKWTPHQIETALWLDGEDSDTFTLVSDAVSEWRDKSGNSNHATQSTSGNRPFYNSVSRRVEFAKANSHFLDLATQPFTATDPRTVFAVLNVATYGSVGNGFFSASNSAASTLGRLWDLCIESAGVYIRVAGNDYFTPTVPVRTDAIIACQWEDGDSSTSKVWHNGTGLTRGGGNAQDINTLSGIARIGRTEGQGDTYFDGSISELIVVVGNLSGENRQKIKGYLAHKWGLAANLPASHPYQDVAP